MLINRPKVIFIFLLMATLTVVGRTQTEILTNVQVIEMAKAGLGEEIILNKIKSSECKFDVSVDALIELKKAGVSDATIGFMVEKASEKAPADASAMQPMQGYSYSQSFRESGQLSRTPVPPKEALENAKTIALVKASLNPSRQALEKELMKRPEWKKFNLSIERYKDHADLYVEIGFVPLSLVTHRYVYRIYDRRSGTVIAAGETTSWGSLAENLARHITRSLAALAS